MMVGFVLDAFCSNYEVFIQPQQLLFKFKLLIQVDNDEPPEGEAQAATKPDEKLSTTNPSTPTPDTPSSPQTTRSTSSLLSLGGRCTSVLLLSELDPGDGVVVLSSPMNLDGGSRRRRERRPALLEVVPEDFNAPSEGHCHGCSLTRLLTITAAHCHSCSLSPSEVSISTH